MNVGEWRWIRPEADCGLLEYVGGREWLPGLVIEISGHPSPVSAFLEAQDGRRGTVAIDRVGEPCRESEFFPSAWAGMQTRAAAVAASMRKGEACSP